MLSAIRSGEIRIVKRLLAAGAHLKIEMLQEAIRLGDRELLEYLKSSLGEHEALNEYTDTILPYLEAFNQKARFGPRRDHYTNWSRLECRYWLEDQSPNKNLWDVACHHGRTSISPLLVACYKGQTEIVKSLIDAGTDGTKWKLVFGVAQGKLH